MGAGTTIRKDVEERSMVVMDKVIKIKGRGDSKNMAAFIWCIA